MEQILIVEDNSEERELLSNLLCDLGRVTTAGSLTEAGRCIDQDRYDVIVLDLSLPDGQSFKFCSKLQSRETVPPIIFLTGDTDVDSKLTAFSLGAADYVIKPFEPRELKARVASQLRRHKAVQGPDGFKRGDLKFILSSQKVFMAKSGVESPLTLTSNEFKLLIYLATREDHLLSRTQILNELWPGTNITDRTIDTHISNLRKKITGSTCRIISVYGQGYRFISSNPLK